jgi:hypothetical protein
MAEYIDNVPLRYKAPADAIFVFFDHTEWLAEETPVPTVTSSSWATVPADGLTLSAEDFDDTGTLVKIAAGTMHALVLLTNVYGTSNGETKQRSIWVRLRLE